MGSTLTIWSKSILMYFSNVWIRISWSTIFFGEQEILQKQSFCCLNALLLCHMIEVEHGLLDIFVLKHYSFLKT